MKSTILVAQLQLVRFSGTPPLKMAQQRLMPNGEEALRLLEQLQPQTERQGLVINRLRKKIEEYEKWGEETVEGLEVYQRQWQDGRQRVVELERDLAEAKAAITKRDEQFGQWRVTVEQREIQWRNSFEEQQQALRAAFEEKKSFLAEIGRLKDDVIGGEVQLQEARENLQRAGMELERIKRNYEAALTDNQRQVRRHERRNEELERELMQKNYAVTDLNAQLAKLRGDTAMAAQIDDEAKKAREEQNKQLVLYQQQEGQLVAKEREAKDLGLKMDAMTLTYNTIRAALVAALGANQPPAGSSLRAEFDAADKQVRALAASDKPETGSVFTVLLPLVGRMMSDAKAAREQLLLMPPPPAAQDTTAMQQKMKDLEARNQDLMSKMGSLDQTLVRRSQELEQAKGQLELLQQQTQRTGDQSKALVLVTEQRDRQLAQFQAQAIALQRSTVPAAEVAVVVQQQMLAAAGLDEFLVSPLDPDAEGGVAIANFDQFLAEVKTFVRETLVPALQDPRIRVMDSVLRYPGKQTEHDDFAEMCSDRLWARVIAQLMGHHYNALMPLFPQVWFYYMDPQQKKETPKLFKALDSCHAAFSAFRRGQSIPEGLPQKLFTQVRFHYESAVTELSYPRGQIPPTLAFDFGASHSDRAKARGQPAASVLTALPTAPAVAMIEAPVPLSRLLDPIGNVRLLLPTPAPRRDDQKGNQGLEVEDFAGMRGRAMVHGRARFSLRSRNN
jgi:hypothetical protein